MTTKEVAGIKISSVWNFFGRGVDEVEILTVVSVRSRSNGRFAFNCVNKTGTGVKMVLTKEEFEARKVG